jgi:3-dehydroquinate synthase
VTAQIYAIRHSCAMKAAIVAEDEREAGRRALLNLGHTFGHALEAIYGYGDKLLHGESVALGMLMAFELSIAMKLCPPDRMARIVKHFEETGLPVKLPDTDLSLDKLMDYMAHDKKAEGGKLTLILAKDIGQCFVARDVDPAPVRDVWQRRLAA